MDHEHTAAPAQWRITATALTRTTAALAAAAALVVLVAVEGLKMVPPDASALIGSAQAQGEQGVEAAWTAHAQADAAGQARRRSARNAAIVGLLSSALLWAAAPGWLGARQGRRR